MNQSVLLYLLRNSLICGTFRIHPKEKCSLHKTAIISIMSSLSLKKQKGMTT